MKAAADDAKASPAPANDAAWKAVTSAAPFWASTTPISAVATMPPVRARALVGSLTEALPRGKAVLYRLFKSRERSKVVADARHIRFADLIANDGLKDAPAIGPEDVALLQYTGGTTGTPKGAVLTHANLTANAQQVNAIDPRAGGEDRILGALPLFHVFANTCVLNRTVLNGGEMVLLLRFEPALALATIARRKVTSVPGVPTMYRVLLDHPDVGKHDLSSIRVCVSGGAPMPLELKQRFEAATGAVVVEGYGLTETSGVVATNPYEGMNKAGSIGLPLPGTDVVIVPDPDDREGAHASYVVGELTVKGPQVMRSYWNKSLETKDVFTNDGYLRTGDVGYIDQDGYVFIVDRLKDIIMVGGFKVFPSRLEEALYAHPAVQEALVIGAPDAKMGERPKAFVTLAPDSVVTPQELLDWLNARVGKHERAVAVEVRASLPKTMIGKLSKKELIAEERARGAA